MKKRNVIYILIIGFILVNCDKDNNIEKKGKNTTEIIIGDYEYMNVNQYDTVVFAFDPDFFNLDINNDSIPDIRFDIEITQSQALGTNSFPEIMCLHNNIQMSGFYNIDTTFLNIDTTFVEAFNDSVYSFNYNCQRKNNADLIYSTFEKFHLNILLENSVVSINDTFKTDTIGLSGINYSFPSGIIEYNGKNIWVQSNYNFNCYSVQRDKPVYLGIKFKDTNKLGWIKFSVCGDINIFESALQE